MRWVGHAERTGRTTAGHFVSVGEHKRKYTTGKLQRKWQSIIQTDIHEIGEDT